MASPVVCVAASLESVLLLRLDLPLLGCKVAAEVAPLQPLKLRGDNGIVPSPVMYKVHSFPDLPYHFCSTR